MAIAINTNILVRLFVCDDQAQHLAAEKLIARAVADDEPVLILLGVLLETEWVLRSRYKLDKPSIAQAFFGLLGSAGVDFEHAPTVEEALYVWNQHPRADFADCLFGARAAHLGCSRFLTFDAGAVGLPGLELLDIYLGKYANTRH